MRLILLLFLIAQASALSIHVLGDCVNQKIYISTDEPSFLIIRMNHGVPIYANSSEEVVFVPKIAGELLITAFSDGKEVSRIVNVRECSTPSPSIGTSNTLPDGNFEELGKKISWRTAYGALKKACAVLGYSYTPKLTDWGIFVDCIRNVCTGSLGKTSGWMYWVNYPEKPMPGVSATEYRIYPGDEVLWYFSRGMEEKPDSSPYSIKVRIGSNYEVYVTAKWESRISPIADFEFTPQNPYVGEEVTFDASKSFDDGEIVDYIWKLEGKELRGKVVVYRFEKEGNYEVELTVFDNEGLYSSKTKIVSVRAKESSEKFLVQGEKVLNLGFGLLRIRADNAEVSLKNESCKVPKHRVIGCFNLESNASISATLETAEELKVLDISKDRWVPMKKNGENFTANISAGKFAVLAEWKNFPLKNSDERIKKALSYLKSLQREDGGFGEKESLISATCWAIMAIVSANENVENWKVNERSPIDYLRENLGREVPKMGTADLARTILAIIYAKKDPRSFGGYDLVAMLKGKVKENGQIGDYVYTTIWGALALSSAGEDISKSVEWLKSVQNPDGGFAWVEGEKSDCDDTSAAVQLLMLAKEYSAVEKALDYLKTCQNPDGGMKYFGESASNSASDSWAIQALVSAGENPMEFRKNLSVVEHLLSLQTSEGYFKYTAFETSNPGYMTSSAIMALLGKYHPIRAMPVYAISLKAENETKVTFPMQIFSETGVDELTLITNGTANLTVRFEKLEEVPENLKLENALLYFSLSVSPPISGYIKFAVPRDGSYVLMKFDGEKWTKLESELIATDESYAYYKAYVPSFSYFAVALENQKPVTTTPQTVSNATTTTATTATTSKTPEKSIPGFEIILALLSIALALRLRR